MPSAPQVYVITLSWNRQEDTLRCLKSLAQMTYPCFSLLLVDNASTDGTVAAVRAGLPLVEIIVNPTNFGFSGGFNVGLRHTLEQGADYSFIINNDTYVAPNLLDELMRYADQPGVGMLAPKVFYANEPRRIWSVGGQRSRWTYEMVNVGNRQLDQGQWEAVQERDYLVGCALLLKRSLLETVGLFDDNTFHPAYYEDSDLCLRARQAGHRLLLVPSGHVWHTGEASSGGYDSPAQRYLMARNSVRFFRKHVRGWRWLIVVSYRLGSALKTSLRLLLARHPRAAAAYWRGLLSGVFGPTHTA